MSEYRLRRFQFFQKPALPDSIKIFKAGASRLNTAYGGFIFFSKTGAFPLIAAYDGFNFLKAGDSRRQNPVCCSQCSLKKQNYSENRLKSAFKAKKMSELKFIGPSKALTGCDNSMFILHS